MSDADSPKLQKPTNIDQNKNTYERLLIFEGAYTFLHEIGPGNGESSSSRCAWHISIFYDSNSKIKCSDDFEKSRMFNILQKKSAPVALIKKSKL